MTLDIVLFAGMLICAIAYVIAGVGALGFLEAYANSDPSMTAKIATVMVWPAILPLFMLIVILISLANKAHKYGQNLGSRLREREIEQGERPGAPEAQEQEVNRRQEIESYEIQAQI